MKTPITHILSVIGLAFSIITSAIADVPKLLSYQGRVTVNGVNFDGTGQFRFELVNGTGTVTYWSSGAGTVAVPVNKGAYSVLLGDAGMNSIPYAVFSHTDVRLRVWFDDGVHGLQPLSPDQRIASVGYAMAAATATVADTAGSAAELHAVRDTANWDVTVWDSLTSGDSIVTNPLVFSTNGLQVAALGVRDDEEGIFPLFHTNALRSNEIESGHAQLGTLRIADEAIMMDHEGISTSGRINAEGSISSSANLGADGDLFIDDVNAGGNIVAQGDITAMGRYHGTNFGPIMATGNIHTVQDLGCEGNLWVAGSKFFIQPHPADQTKVIAYTCLEGPEAGTYVRGTASLVDGVAQVAIPDHFEMVTSPGGLTVQLTPRGEWLHLFVESVTPGILTVREASGRSGMFDYFIQGVRKGYEGAPVIRDRAINRQEAK